MLCSPAAASCSLRVGWSAPTSSRPLGREASLVPCNAVSLEDALIVMPRCPSKILSASRLATWRHDDSAPSTRHTHGMAERFQSEAPSKDGGKGPDRTKSWVKTLQEKRSESEDKPWKEGHWKRAG